METSAVLASAQDRVVGEVVASLERRDQAHQHASSPEQRRRDVRHLFEPRPAVRARGQRRVDHHAV